MSGVLMEFIIDSLTVVWVIFLVVVTFVIVTFCCLKVISFLIDNGVL